MPRRGWRAVGAPAGWYEVIRGPRPPSVSWLAQRRGVNLSILRAIRGAVLQWRQCVHSLMHASRTEVGSKSCQVQVELQELRQERDALRVRASKTPNLIQPRNQIRQKLLFVCKVKEQSAPKKVTTTAASRSSPSLTSRARPGKFWARPRFGSPGCTKGNAVSGMAALKGDTMVVSIAN